MIIKRLQGDAGTDVLYPAVKPAMPSLSPAAKEQIQLASMAQAFAQSSGVVDLSDGQTIELGMRPNSTLVTSKGKATNSTPATVNAIIDTYAFNTDVYNKSTPENSALTLTSAQLEQYNDGFAGKNINRLINLSNMGRGLKLKQMTFIALNEAGNQDLSILEGLEFTFQSYNGIGGKAVPVVLDLSTAIRNNAFQGGVLTVNYSAWINGATQVSWITPAGATVSVNFIWE